MRSWQLGVLRSQISYVTPDENEFNCVIKFGSASVDSADGMREVAEFIRNFDCLIRSFESFEDKRPVIVLSAMGNSSNKLLLAGEMAAKSDVSDVCDIEELTFIKHLHLRTADELGVDREIISKLLFELEQLLKVFAMTKEMNLRAKDYVVSFGERMSTRIFAAYLNKIGLKARAYDSFEIGYIITDDFTNVDILEATYPDVAKRLRGELISDPAIPIVTGFLEKVNVLQSQNSYQTLNANDLNCVIKFGSSYVDSADKMREVAEFIRNFDLFIRSFESFEEKRPVIILSAMGEITNKFQLAAKKAADRDTDMSNVSETSNLEDLIFIKDLYFRTVDELGIDREIISENLYDFEHILRSLFMIKSINPVLKEYVVSFGEHMSTVILAAYLNKIGVKAREYDSFKDGFIAIDDFTNADIFEATYPAFAKRLHGDWISDPSIPIVTGSPGKGLRSCTVITLGCGDTDVIATTIGKALGLTEIHVWKNHQAIHPQDVEPDNHAKNTYNFMPIKNIYNAKACGTSLIRYMSEGLFLLLPKLLNLSDLVIFMLFPKRSRLLQIFQKLLNLVLS